MSPDGAGATRPLLWCEELFLLLTTDAGAREGFGTQRGIGLAAALLADLVAAGRVSADDGDQRVRVVDATPTGDDVLDAALMRVSKKDGARFADLVRDRALNPEEAVGRRLAAAGILERRPGLLGGLVPAKYPTLDDAPEAAVRARLAAALTTGVASEGDVTLLSILVALGVERTVLADDVPQLSRRALRERITQIAGARPAGDAVASALRALSAAVAMAGISGAISS